jgi:iron complex transport system ATP-binding protein
MIRLESLSIGYDRRPSVSGIELEVKPGDVIATLGRNGSGKSTLLKTIAGLVPPVSGRVLVEDRDVASLGPRERARKIAFVPQQETPMFEFTVRQIVLMGRIAAGTGLFETAEDQVVAEEAMRRTDLLPLADRSFQKISGGERQRALIARAIAQEAKVLLLDEPNAHLDLEHQAELVSLLRSLAGQGYTVLAALHDLSLASVLAPRALLLHQGEVAFHGLTEDLLRSPLLPRVFGVPFRTVAGGAVLPDLGGLLAE